MGGARARGMIFDEDAELYDRARPGYPREIFDDLAELAGLGAGSRILEIGCGTGQATGPLAERGYEVVALEPGAAMAAVARRNLERFGGVRVEVTRFEDWTPPRRPFDAVVAATSFHWIDPTVRVVKAAGALRPGGSVATISTHHVAGGDQAFFREVQACYERWDPETEPGLELPAEENIPLDSAELDESGLFGPATFRRYPWEKRYSAHEYEQLLLTYSGHRALEPDARSKLLACIKELIESRFGGHITKRYLFQLRVASPLR
jgi:SAM-dependent methyltransferase